MHFNEKKVKNESTATLHCLCQHYNNAAAAMKHVASATVLNSDIIKIDYDDLRQPVNVAHTHTCCTAVYIST